MVRLFCMYACAALYWCRTCTYSDVANTAAQKVRLMNTCFVVLLDVAT
jgi:hypothetical protein